MTEYFTNLMLLFLFYSRLRSVRDDSVHAIVAADAFQWFATVPSLFEIARVLPRRGYLGLVWTSVDWKRAAEGGAPWAVLLSKFLAAEGVIQRQKEDGKRAYGHERGEAEAVLAAIHRVTTSAESNKQNYLSLLTYIVSLLLFLVVVMMQRVPQEMFQVEEAVRSALLADEGGLVESFSGEAATEIDAMTDVRVCVYVCECYVCS